MRAPPPTEDEPRIAAGLVSRIAAGDGAAESEMVERYSRGVLFMLRRTCSGDFDLADDLHQETFRIVLERLRGASLAEPERLAGFLWRTARNVFIAEVRKRSRRRTDDLGDVESEVVDPAPGHLSQSLVNEEAAMVRRMIGELRGARDREMLYRFYVAEEPKHNICQELGLSSLHFNRILYRARQRLKDLFERANKKQHLAAGKS